MSFSATAWVNAVAPIIRNGPRIAVLRCLADHMNQGTGLCCPKVATIARETGFCERSVQNCLRWAERAGLLTTEQRGRRSSLYILHVGRVPSGGGGEPSGRPGAAPQGDALVHLNPPVRVHVARPEPEEDLTRKGEPRESAQARAHPSPPDQGEIFEGEEDVPPPTAEEQQAATEAGHDLAELPEERADWWRRGRPTTLPPGWRASPEGRDYCFSRGHDPDELERKFIRHYSLIKPNVRAGCWDALFESWADKEAKLGGSRAYGRRHHNTGDDIRRVLAKAFGREPENFTGTTLEGATL